MSVRCYTWHTEPEIAAEYLSILSKFGGDDEMRLWAEGYVDYHAGRLKWDVDFLTRHYRFVKCLNIGGAPYLFEYLMSRSRPEMTLATVDLEPSRFPRAGDILRTSLIKADIEQENALGTLGNFQCIVFCEIFEHLRIDILRTMKAVRALLSDDGILYLTMPNGLGLSAWLNFARGRTGPPPVAEWRKLSQLGHMGHVREYSVYEIKEVLEACGLQIKQYFYRRRSSYRGTTRSAIRETAQILATHLMPSLGDEIVLVAGKAL